MTGAVIPPVPVPSGSVNDIIKWAGDDHDRLSSALNAERLSKDPRKSLITKLEARLGVR